jgi:hypothetical protein
MTTITLDDALIGKVIAVSHTQNAQEALTKNNSLLLAAT